MKPPSISIKNVSCQFDTTLIFQNLNLTLHAGRCTCILGPSGVGKTTLLRFVAGLQTHSGSIVADNASPISQQLTYMAQTDSLLPWLTATQNVLLSQKLTDTKACTQRLKQLFAEMGLTGAEHKLPKQLSGGMRQRVALIRTFLQDKPIVLMDEPFSAVDAITRFELQTLAAHFLKNRTTLLVTHDPFEALRLANEIYILSGKPVKLKKVFESISNTPRELADIEVVQNYSLLFKELTQAKELTVCN